MGAPVGAVGAGEGALVGPPVVGRMFGGTVGPGVVTVGLAVGIGSRGDLVGANIVGCWVKATVFRSRLAQLEAELHCSLIPTPGKQDAT